jgi:hypothetical protein
MLAAELVGGLALAELVHVGQDHLREPSADRVGAEEAVEGRLRTGSGTVRTVMASILAGPVLFGQSLSRSASCARRAIWTRLSTSSFMRTGVTCALTVPRLMLELGADFGVRLALRDRDGDLLLAVCEPGEQPAAAMPCIIVRSRASL